MSTINVAALPVLIRTKISHTANYVCPNCNVGILEYDEHSKVMECQNCDQVFAGSDFVIPESDGKYANTCVEPDTSLMTFLDPVTQIISGSVLFASAINSYFLFTFNVEHRMFVLFPFDNNTQEIKNEEPLDAHGSLANAELGWEVVGTTVGRALNTSCNTLSAMFLPENVIPNTQEPEVEGI